MRIIIMHQLMGIRAFEEAVYVFIPVGNGAVCGGGDGVVKTMGGCLASSWIVTLVIHWLSISLTCKRKFFGSCHPLMMVSLLRVTLQLCLWKKSLCCLCKDERQRDNVLEKVKRV
jgi:hypothetical protein